MEGTNTPGSEPPTQQSPPPEPQPPAERPWEVPVFQTATPQQGQRPSPPGGYASVAPQQRPLQTPPVAQPRVAGRHIGLIIGVIAIVFVVGVIAVGVVGYLLLRDKVSAAIDGVTSGASGPPATVKVDGQPLTIKSSPSCRRSGGQIIITIDPTQSMSVFLNDANPPQVELVGLGNISGLNFGYNKNLGQDTAMATKDGNTFKITGTASGVDLSNPVALPLKKPFEIDVTCPHL